MYEKLGRALNRLRTPKPAQSELPTKPKAPVVPARSKPQLAWQPKKASILRPPTQSSGKASAVRTATHSPTISSITAEQLRQIVPNLAPERARMMVPHLNAAMKEAQINTRARAAAFVAQVAHESGGLRYFEELASGSEYEGRRDLGNTQKGDGVRFKGRGPIQLTGRRNYEVAGKALGIDLIKHPNLAATPEVGFRIASWFWEKKGLNELADRGEFNKITCRINGSQNGKTERREYFAEAKEVLRKS